MTVKLISAANLPSVEFNFILVKYNLVRIKVKSSDNLNAFEVTEEVFNPEGLPHDGHMALNNITDYVTVPKEGEEFYFEIHEYKNLYSVLYSTKGQPMIITKYFTKIAAVINSNGRIFGLGERVGDLLLSEGVYTIWTRDEPSPVENGRRPGNNIYGAHPVYFTQLKTGNNFFAVFDNNAGAQDYIIESNPNGMRMTQIKTSGLTDMYVFTQNTIQDLIPEFIDLVGKPALVPEWGLGWHQCRWGYNNTDDVENVVKSYRKNNIPLDAIWTDIDYMDQYRDFTISDKNFKNLSESVAKWQDDYDIHYVPILDAAIAYEPDNSNSAYKSGKELGIFIKDPNDPTKPFIGKVWPGDAVYIDWLHKDAEKWWHDQVYDLYYKLGFDGLWIDMNEASNFCNGHCLKQDQVAKSVQNNLFYIPGGRDLNTKSISIDALHANGTTEFEAHSLYGFYMTKATNQFFKTQKKRPFIISRSTFSGAGKFGSKWLGDNFSTYDMMKQSVNGIYLSGMVGIPFVGADICGFLGDTNPALCARWYALGVFYPFSRNHNDLNAIDQEPYVDMFAKTKVPGYDTTITDVIREMSWKRYALHRYAYTNMHMASHEGVPYFKPLFFNYPDEDLAFANVDKNILIGDSIKVSAVFHEQDTDSFYFPGKGAIWCPIWPEKNRDCFAGQSTQKNIGVPLFEVLAHIKSGSVIPLQLGNLTDVDVNMNLAKLERIPLDLGILVDSDYTATGFVRYDGGVTTDILKYTEFQFSVKGSAPFLGNPYLSIAFKVGQDDSVDRTSENQDLNSVVIYNAKVFKLSSSSVATLTMRDQTNKTLSVQYDEYNHLCRFTKEGTGRIRLRDVEKISISS
jgi:alpha-glucosidase (family GH31 glycosyl hydrolase)